jgi:hypothetical protein
VEGTNFFTQHRMFMTTNRTRMILPEECEGCRFGVGHAEFGLMFFKPLSDSHLAQHLALLNIVPTEVCYMTKVTSENNGSPQITRVLRDREEQADMVDNLQSGSAAYTLARVKTVQELILAYEKSVETATPANLAVTFEQVSGDAQYGGAPQSDALTVGGGGPVAIAAAGSRPGVGTPAHNPATHPFGPTQVQEFTAAQVELDGLTARKVQMLLDIETCTPLLRSNIAAEKEGAVEGLRMVHTQVHVWQQKVEAILMAAYSFLPSLLTRADVSERGVLYNGYRILIEQVTVLATRKLNPGVVAFGVHSQALHHVHAQRDLHDLLTHHSVGAGALANPARRLPPPPPGFATPTGYSLQPNGTFEQWY